MDVVLVVGEWAMTELMYPDKEEMLRVLNRYGDVETEEVPRRWRAWLWYKGSRKFVMASATAYSEYVLIIELYNDFREKVWQRVLAYEAWHK